MRKQFLIPAVSALSIALAACSTPPNPNLEKAQADYAALQAQPQASQLAALETKDAGEWVDKASKAYREGNKEEKVDQLAYLANQRIQLAMQTVKLRMTEQQLQGVDAQRTQARLDARTAQLKQLQGQLNAKQTERGTVVTFGNVLFDLNQATLKPAGMTNVQQLATFLQQNPERQVIVEGYTDSTGSDSYNQQLSERRANAIKTALVSMGISPTRIVTRGYGKSFPVASNSTAADRAMNRRVEVTISNDANPVAPRM
ncbi:porin [Pseudomonas asuensis]|jgi:outer membrane protein OmpA-like peptidoglycan-associated protein|uniref:Porin n=1 Tax=Pseudomonas asuensis TaxID=1825787 RepID=A0ABQ2GFV6_9PSED|nr:OmpA family protein [Pseudomonas asuensis]GGL93186.1 porin [Pseudomonas asuensis]